MRAISAVLLLFIVGTFSHAVLLQPAAWWRTPSRGRPCGGAAYVANPSATWPVGSVQTMKWWVVAGDGIGVVHGRINTEGETNFFANNSKVVNVTIQQPENGYRSMGAFYPNITVPNVECTGPNKTCVLQVWTNGGGGWYSCATINITCKGCAEGYPISQDNCVKASGLDFCEKKNGKNVVVPAGQTANQVDTLVSGTYDLNQPNPLVFNNGNRTECKNNYHEMICELYFPECQFNNTNNNINNNTIINNNTNSNNNNYYPVVSSYTQQECQKVVYQECNITELHYYLYDCSVFPPGPTTAPPLSSLSFSLSFSLSLFLSLSLLLCSLF